ncbi:MAG TPA: hypothetical protein VNH11_30260 [Pirellulales bacterium]|nr:hypothetical protein [Pirellulales bacterium]
MNSIDKRRAALAGRLGIGPEELDVPADAAGEGIAFQLLPGGLYWVYSPDEEKQAFKSRVPDVPFLSQIRDDEGQSYNVYLAVGDRRCGAELPHA